jgi:hypothetical protein
VPEGFEKGHAENRLLESRCWTLASLRGCGMLEAPPLQLR